MTLDQLLVQINARFGVDIKSRLDACPNEDLAIRELERCQKDVQRAFKRMARRYHPDVGGDHEKMVEIARLKDLAMQIKFGRRPSFVTVRMYTANAAGWYSPGGTTSGTTTSGTW